MVFYEVKILFSLCGAVNFVATFFFYKKKFLRHKVWPMS